MKMFCVHFCAQTIASTSEKEWTKSILKSESRQESVKSSTTIQIRRIRLTLEFEGSEEEQRGS